MPNLAAPDADRTRHAHDAIAPQPLLRRFVDNWKWEIRTGHFARCCSSMTTVWPRTDSLGEFLDWPSRSQLGIR